MSSALEISTTTFDDEVLKSPTPVIVDFWAEWCMPCRMLGPIVDQVAQEFSGKVKVAKINVDQYPELAAKFGIRGIPTLLLFNNGVLAERMVGVQPKAVISSKLNEILGS